eukprot:TRINITY_DN4053_c0_g1_i1.p1 TRINITY_DN4053_c0_g1~~TRINITY_DN4053_c0_g1_i1.p1  ORF type:complete len:570 (+),score=252.65 TRINITY_DN4053_c0_g1_i1:396-2105(+)
MSTLRKFAVLLFRNDLRIHDNEMIIMALKRGEIPVPLYCFDRNQISIPTHYFKLQPRCGIYRTRFLYESIQDLRLSLRNLGSDLLIRIGNPQEIIAQLIEEFNSKTEGSALISNVYLQREVTSEETIIEKKLSTLLKKFKIKPTYYWGTTLIHEEEVSNIFNGINNLPDTFSGFRVGIEKRNTFPIRSLLQPLLFPSIILNNSNVTLPEIPNWLERGRLPDPVQDLGLPPHFAGLHLVDPEDPNNNINRITHIDQRAVLQFKGGETEAIKRLRYYLWESDLLRVYKETRNGLVGGDYSSKFSPWLALGCISPRYIYNEIQRYERERERNESTYWLIFELLWRDYFRFYALKFGNKLFAQNGTSDKQIQWRTDMQAFEKWCNGQTGFPLIDANMRELALTGFMSNRGRQIVASFLTKDLRLNWLLGAEYFEKMLNDYDVCSNYGNWQYVAGCGNDPREDRYFNVIKQGKVYDAKADYIRLWVPEIIPIPRNLAHEPWNLSIVEQNNLGLRLGDTYPHPIVDAHRISATTKHGTNNSNHFRGRSQNNRRNNENNSRNKGHQQNRNDYKRQF